MPEEIRDEGIVLQSTPFRDYDSILTVFTKLSGLIQMTLRGVRRPKKTLQGLITPLTHIELLISPTKSEWHRFHEGHPIHSFLSLRNDLNLLKIACYHTEAIRSSQMLGKAAPLLYKLTLHHLHHLAKSPNPSNLLRSFRLKILRHEGTFNLTSFCSSCKTQSQEIFVFQGEGFCSKHCPPASISFSQKEVGSLQTLMFSRDFHSIESVSVEESLNDKILKLFKQCK